MQCIESATTLSNSTSSTILTLYSSSSVNYLPFQTHIEESKEIAQCVWRRSGLTSVEFVIYAFVVPTLAFFGLLTNFINFIVFMRPKMTPSAFSYLAALSVLDCISCLLITLTSFSRSFLNESTFWMVFDFQWQTPLFGITTGAANIILACVSLDRFIYLRWGIPNGTPKFCRRFVARRMIGAVILLVTLVNVPYFLVFVVNDDGTLETTEFYFSKYYMIHNWFSFILLTLLPVMFLVVVNVAILIAFCKWTKQSKKCQSNCPNSKNKNCQNRYKHQMKLTVSIVIVITLYLVGELPANLTSRKNAVNLLYGGDATKVDFQMMQRLEVICVTLNVVQLSMNIVVYAVTNPCFVSEFFKCLKGASNVCFRFMGLMAVASFCEKCWNSVYKRKEHTNIECVNNSASRDIDYCQDEIISDVDYQATRPVGDTTDVSSTANAVDKKLEIPVKYITNSKVSFDNPSFNLEI